jgi:hypothetical protein
MRSGLYNLPMRLSTAKPRLLTTILVMLGFGGAYAGQTDAPSAETTPLDGLRPATSNGRWGYVNSEGRFVIKPKYFAAQPFKEGLALVITRKSWQPLGREYGEFRLAQITSIDDSGHEIRSPLSARRAAGFSDGLAVVVPDSALRVKGACAKGGYLNTKGEWAMKPQFDDLRDFSDGLAAVNLGAKCGTGGRWGYIDKGGHVAIPMKFLSAGQFHDGRACVAERPGESEVIDRSGNVVPGEKCR